ncbi:MAG TPA: hypothetical protein VEA59_00945 [Patescibacteria group bacterium]|nr:hypothetical protein [Patescibacteria group bacterium]
MKDIILLVLGFIALLLNEASLLSGNCFTVLGVAAAIVSIMKSGPVAARQIKKRKDTR